MEWAMGVLVFLVVLAVYCALVVSKRTDERIRRYVSEDADGSPMTVRFPDEVLRATQPSASVRTKQGQAL